MIFLRIAGSPPRSFYRDATALPYLTAGEARHELLETAGTVRSDIAGEASNVTVTLRNDAAQCVRLFANPPIGAAAELHDELGLVFAGIVRTVGLDSAPASEGNGPTGTCQLGIEA